MPGYLGAQTMIQDVISSGKENETPNMTGGSNDMMSLLSFKNQYCTLFLKKRGKRVCSEFYLTDAQIPQVYIDFLLVTSFQNVIMSHWHKWSHTMPTSDPKFSFQ